MLYLSVFIHITLIDRSKYIYIYIIYIICVCIERCVYFNERYSNTTILSSIEVPESLSLIHNQDTKEEFFIFFFPSLDIDCYHVLGS